MYSKKQQGKGLIAFLAGSVVALIAIAVMLITLNRNSEKTFKQPELTQQPPKPEILTPSSNTPTVSAPQIDTTANINPQPTASGLSAPSSGTTAQPMPANTVPDKENTAVVTQEEINKTFEDNMAIERASDTAPVAAAKPKTNVAPTKDKPKTIAKTDSKPAQQTVTEEEIKPTAQQILDSGNLEKAREVARKEAQAKAQAANKAKEKVAAKDSTAPTANKDNTATRSAVSIQAGAYSNKKAAEEQRAKLALLGVQTQIVPVTSGGKTLYRVQTSKLQGDKADQVQQTLQKNGVNTITHK